MVLKFPEATSNERGRKIYLARLKKLADDGQHIEYAKNRFRFKVADNFRSRVAVRKAKGMETAAASDHAILKKSFNPKKSATKNKKNTRAKTAKGKAKNTKKDTKKRKGKESKRTKKAAETKKAKADKAKKGAADKGRSVSKPKGKSPAKGKGR